METSQPDLRRVHFCDNVCKVPVLRRRGQMFFIKNVSAYEDSRDEPNMEYTLTDPAGRDLVCYGYKTATLSPCILHQKGIGDESLIQTHLLNPRWLLSAVRAPDTVYIPPVVPYKEGPVLQRQKAPWARTTSFVSRMRLERGSAKQCASME